MWDRDHTQWHLPSNIASQDLKTRVELEEKAEAGDKAGAKVVPTLLPSPENILTRFPASDKEADPGVKSEPALGFDPFPLRLLSFPLSLSLSFPTFANAFHIMGLGPPTQTQNPSFEPCICAPFVIPLASVSLMWCQSKSMSRSPA